jgi:hypothetical protein
VVNLLKKVLADYVLCSFSLLPSPFVNFKVVFTCTAADSMT